MTRESRREFLVGLGTGLAAVPRAMGQAQEWSVEETPGAPFLLDLAERELLVGLTRLRGGRPVRLVDRAQSASGLRFSVRRERDRLPQAEAYEIRRQGSQVVLTGASEAAALHAVYDLLERQGVFHGIDGASYPLDPIGELTLPPESAPWTAAPRFAVRGLLPWPDFLNCITVYNEEDFRAYFEGMLRMRFNTFGMHVYTGAEQWAESYLSFEFGGVGHLSFLDTSASHRWGYLPQRTSSFGMGAADFYDGEVFGADATRFARDPWEQAERTRRLLRDAFAYAARLGLRTGIGFEPYQIPDEIWRALPPEARIDPGAGARRRAVRFDIESHTAKRMLEARLAQLLEAYPTVEYVWLWEDESMNWESRKTGIPLAVTPFLQAHDFLRRHAPRKRLVVSGWGGVARHFADFHRRLPGDIIFTCLSDSLGWDPVHEVFGKLEGRERWPIPWLEDDPGMWLPQFHVRRFQRDLDLAAQYGCQGLLGIHWRHRIVDPTAGYQARYSWSTRPQPADYYAAYARTQAAGGRAPRLARLLDRVDRERAVMSTFTGQISDGHSEIAAYSGDYNEAFTFWSGKEAPEATVASQKEVAAALRALCGEAGSPLERERLEYLAGSVEFLVPYAAAWNLARRIHSVLEEAAKRKKDSGEAAREHVRAQAVPLWLELTGHVRAAMLAFQRIVATRNDLGTLASKQNKFVRLALVRLRLSIEEYLGESPEALGEAVAAAMAPDPDAPVRLIVPARPTLLSPAERVRVPFIATGSQPVGSAVLRTRVRGGTDWVSTPARLMGRRTFAAQLGPFPATAVSVEYHFEAEIGGNRVAAPAGAPVEAYVLTVSKEFVSNRA